MPFKKAISELELAMGTANEALSERQKTLVFESYSEAGTLGQIAFKKRVERKFGLPENDLLDMVAIEMPDIPESRLRDSLTNDTQIEGIQALRAYFVSIMALVARGVSQRVSLGQSQEQIAVWVEARVQQATADFREVLAPIFAGAYIAGAESLEESVEVPENAPTVNQIATPEVVQEITEEVDRASDLIQNATIAMIIAIIGRGLANGGSGADISRDIRGLTGAKNTVFDRDVNGRDRSERLAIDLIYRLYGRGQHGMARSLAPFLEDGEQLQKQWVDSNDERVRPLHVNLGGTGWVAWDFQYPGGLEPGQPINCRCVSIWRIAFL